VHFDSGFDLDSVTERVFDKMARLRRLTSEQTLHVSPEQQDGLSSNPTTTTTSRLSVVLRMI